MRGTVPEGMEHDVVVEFLQGLDRLVPESSTGDLEQAHLAAIRNAAGQLADQPPALAPRRVRAATFGLMHQRSARVVGVALAAVLALGGTAYAGVLPAAIQNAVAAAVRPLGIVIPAGDHAAADRPAPIAPNTNSRALPASPGRGTTVTVPSANASSAASAAPGHETTPGASAGRGKSSTAGTNASPKKSPNAKTPPKKPKKPAGDDNRSQRSNSTTSTKGE